MSDLFLLALLNYELDGLNLQNINTNSKKDTKETKPKQFEYIFKHNGKDIKLSGPDDKSIMDVVYSLQKNLPTKHTTIQPKITIPNVSTNNAYLTYNSEKFVYLHMNNKIYSGSGSIIYINDIDTKKLKVILFKDSTGKYQETGGRIDKDIAEKYIKSNPDDILFRNAQEKMYIESVLLFKMRTHQNPYIDILATSTNQWYRVFVYVYTADSNQIKNFFKLNKTELSLHDININKLELVDMDMFDNTAIEYYINEKYTGNDIPYGIIQTDDSISVKVRGRTFRLFKHIQNIKELKTDILKDINTDNDTYYYDI